MTKETDERRQKMLEAYIELLRKTALGVGISRRFFIILEFRKPSGTTARISIWSAPT